MSQERNGRLRREVRRVSKTCTHVAEERVNETSFNRATRHAEYPISRISRVIAFRARIERLIEFELQRATHGVKKLPRYAVGARYRLGAIARERRLRATASIRTRCTPARIRTR